MKKTKKLKCSYAKRYQAIWAPLCGCITCEIKWKKANERRKNNRGW